MPRTITLKLSRASEKLINDLGNKYGLNDTELIQQALFLLKEVGDTGRVALLKQYYDEYTAAAVVQYVYKVADAVGQDAQNQQLRVGSGTPMPANGTAVPQGTVVDQAPAPETPILRGDPVDLIVTSSGTTTRDTEY